MAQWKTDEELFALMRDELSTCPVSDVMEQLGFLHPMLPPEIRPVRSDMVMIGRAMPVQDEPPVPYGTPGRFDSKYFGLMFESIDALRRNEVYIASGGPIYAARFGEFLSLRSQKLGAAGAVINGCIRDANRVQELNFPVFTHGTYAYGLQRRHNVVDYRCSIKIGEVRIRPGDLIFGDGDGVCVIPREAEKEIVNKAIEKNRLEANVRRDIEAGESILGAFKKYSVM
jgi:4-hydroxy-4-methyl-2-oxoglutarate aldolase